MDAIMFDEGMQYLHANGLPANCYFALSRRIVGGTSTGGSFAVSDTLVGGIGEINAGGSATGYTRGSAARPAMSGHTDAFPQFTWTTGTATNWPADTRSIVLVTAGTGTSGTAICAANLQAGGSPRDLSQANTTEKVTPTAVFQSGN